MRTASTVARGSLPTQLAGNGLVEEREGHGDGVRDLHGRRRQPRNGGHAIEYLFEREVFAAEDVAFARSAAIKRDHVHAGDLGDIDKVEAGIDVGRKFLVQEVDDDATGRRGLRVTRTDRSRGVEDHHMLASTGGFDGFLLAEEL